MSESHKAAPRDAHGRLLKGFDSLKPYRDPYGANGSPELQKQLQGKTGHLVLRRMMRAKSVSVVNALKRVILDPKTPPLTKVEATRIFMEYGWGNPGKPAQKRATGKGGKGRAQKVVVVSNVPRHPNKKPDVV